MARSLLFWAAVTLSSEVCDGQAMSRVRRGAPLASNTPVVVRNREHNWSKGPPPHYSEVVARWVSKALISAGLQTVKVNVVEMVPDSPGIPGAYRGGTHDPVVQFRADLPATEKKTLRSRAAALKPPIPWLALALYHRGMLQQARPNWAKFRFESMDTVTAVDGRLDFLKAVGMTRYSRVVDAGCGWGRLGRKLMAYLEPDRYFGVDIDKFELRSFIQFEIGLEAPELISKRPRILANDDFNFKKLLGQTLQADYIIFSSVLKASMPISLRYAALRNAAAVLPPGGKVVIFPAGGAVIDCSNSAYNFTGVVGNSKAFSPPHRMITNVNRGKHKKHVPGMMDRDYPIYACIYTRLDCLLTKNILTALLPQKPLCDSSQYQHDPPAS